MKDLFIFQAFFRASSFDSEILKISISKAFSKIVSDEFDRATAGKWPEEFAKAATHHHRVVAFETSLRIAQILPNSGLATVA